MTAETAGPKRMFKITILRPVFQGARFEVEAATYDEALELAQERELTLQESDWQGPWERAIYDETANGLEVFRSGSKPRVSPESG